MTPSAPTFSASTLSGPSVSTADLLRRIDEMPMSLVDRERAKATLRTAECIAEVLVSIVTRIRSLSARIALPSTRRSTLRNSPAPR